MSDGKPAIVSEPRATARGSSLPAWASCVLALIVVAGCGGEAGRLAQLGAIGPNEILATSVARLETAATVHVEATLGGAVNAGVFSSVAGGLPIGLLGTLKLNGAAATSDIDVSSRAVHLLGSFPALFGATAEIILVDGDIYTKISLLGDKFTKSRAPSWPLPASGVPGATFGVADALVQVRAVLATSGTTANLIGRDELNSRDAYHLRVTVPEDGLNRILAAAGVATASRPLFQIGPFDYWVYADTFQPARVRMTITSSTVGTIDVDLALSKYDEPVKIAAPPAGQVKVG